MEALGNVAVCLLEELTHKEDHRCRTVTANVVLGGGRSRDHDRRGVLDLHLSKQDIAIFGEFDLESDVSARLSKIVGGAVVVREKEGLVRTWPEPSTSL